MKKSFFYYILMAMTLPMQLFPLEFHYFLSDGLAFVVQNIFKYRRKTVQENLKNSFPAKSIQELKEIESRFYRRFVATLFESLYLTHISDSNHRERCKFVNDSLFSDLYAKNKNVIIVTGHFGNWEFFKPTPKMVERKGYFIYKKLNNPFFDKFFRDVRSKSQAQPLEMRHAYRTIMNAHRQNTSISTYFISDQRPINSSKSLWLNFLHQETAFMTGAEIIARKTNSAVLYNDIVEDKRGYFTMRFKLITENAAEEPEFFVTKRFAEELEKSINERPDHWLWTHKRWKNKRKDVDAKYVHLE